MIRILIYHASIFTIAITAIGAVVHPRVQTGIIGSLVLMLLAVFTVAALEYDDPANWRFGQFASAAVLCLWLVGRFWWRRSRVKRRLRQVICERCPLHEDA